MIFEAKVKKWGNSLGIILPNKMIKGVNVKEGEFVEVSLVQKKKKKIDGFGICKGGRPFVRDEKFLEGDDRFV
jgi:hypothetical protein